MMLTQMVVGPNPMQGIVDAFKEASKEQPIGFVAICGHGYVVDQYAVQYGTATGDAGIKLEVPEPAPLIQIEN